MLYARAATYLRPRAVPTVHARASAAALSAPPRASARTSGVVESKRQAEVAAVMVAIVPESVEPWEPSKGRIVRCFHCVGHRVDGVARGAIDATWTWHAMPTRTTRRE